MIVRVLLALALLAPLPALADALDAAIDAPLRSEKNRARDVFRHPGPMLAFFEVKPDSVVVEIDPGAGGYWTEILAPYLKANGRYIAANPEPTSEEAKLGAKGFAEKLAANPAAYDKVVTSQFAGDRYAIAAPGSADFVLTFRNLHNWMAKGEAEASLKAFFTALKSGGEIGRAHV